MDWPIPKKGFLIHQELVPGDPSKIVLSPKANTASPAAFTFFAALMSLS